MNFIKGKCPHDCEYCYMKIFPLGKLKFDKHELNNDLGKGNFIFIGSSCDMFAETIPKEWIEMALEHCRKFDNKYLFQSKNPDGIFAVKDLLPKNSVIGTTIETNRDYKISKAPSVLERALSLAEIRKVGFETMVTIEPIMDFDVEDMVEIIKTATPKWVNIGADSKNHNLPEPSKEKVLELIERLKEFTEIRKKNNLGRLM
jgi:DNA repair photolyase